jgi:hypothetical protein
VRLGRITDGEIVAPTFPGLQIERRRCPACGAGLERTAIDDWHTAGSRVLTLLELADADFR